MILKDLDVNYRVCAVSSSQALKAQTVCSIAEKRNESMYMESRFITIQLLFLSTSQLLLQGITILPLLKYK